MARKKRRVCRSKSTGKVVNCKRQAAGRKAARSKGVGKAKRGKGPCKKWAKKKGPGGKRRCVKRGR